MTPETAIRILQDHIIASNGRRVEVCDPSGGDDTYWRIKLEDHN